MPYRLCVIVSAVVIPSMVSRAWAADDRMVLLNVNNAELPNDTALGDASELTVQRAPAGLNGKALRVAFAAGDSFGMSRKSGQSDWSHFSTLQFSVLNPSQRSVDLSFTVRHAATKNFQTRVNVPLKIRSGRNDIRLSLEKMRNSNGSKPVLSKVVHWYVANPPDQTPVLFFTDFVLVRQESASVRPKYQVRIDPARMARIRAAKMPAITGPVAFDSPEADAILSATEVFPADNAFNELVDEWPLHPNSANIIASIGADKPFRYNPDMNFVIVPPGFPRVPVKIVDYPDESDPGPYPVPDGIPIEGWPRGYQRTNGTFPELAEILRRPDKYKGDRHAIVLDPVNKRLYEFFTFRLTAQGWAAGQASIFDLKSNRTRPEGWTSADAAGLPIFPAVVRYDEISRGVVEHAMRVTVRRTRRDYIHPATHFASRLTDPSLPRMGERIRLRRNFDVRGFSPPVQAILRGLQKYGMFVADNGIDWAISVTPDERIPSLHEELRRIRGRDFEVVVAPK